MLIHSYYPHASLCTPIGNSNRPAKPLESMSCSVAWIPVTRKNLIITILVCRCADSSASSPVSTVRRRFCMVVGLQFDDGWRIFRQTEQSPRAVRHPLSPHGVSVQASHRRPLGWSSPGMSATTRQRHATSTAHPRLRMESPDCDTSARPTRPRKTALPADATRDRPPTQPVPSFMHRGEQRATLQQYNLRLRQTPEDNKCNRQCFFNPRQLSVASRTPTESFVLTSIAFSGSIRSTSRSETICWQSARPGGGRRMPRGVLRVDTRRARPEPID